MIMVEYCTEVATGKTDVWSPFTDVEYWVVVLATILLETWVISASVAEVVDAPDSEAEVLSGVSGETSVPLRVAEAVLVNEAPLASVVVYTLALATDAVAPLPVPDATIAVLLPPGTEKGGTLLSPAEDDVVASGETSVLLADAPTPVLVTEAPLASVVVYTLALTTDEVAALPVPVAAMPVLFPPGTEYGGALFPLGEAEVVPSGETSVLLADVLAALVAAPVPVEAMLVPLLPPETG
jgi:hypothetical protein